MSQNNRQRLEQNRANFAFQCAKSAKSADSNKEYKQWAKKVPMMIKSNGLGATLAFLNTKDKAQKKLICDLENWFREDEKCKALITLSKIDYDIVEQITEVEMPEYRALTIEAIAFFTWLRRFADGLIKD
jgi:CRISPR-associated protein Cmr5